MTDVKQYKKGSNIQLSKNIHLSEWDCRCTYDTCQITWVDMDHVMKMQSMREQIGLPIHFNCGYRCERHNKDVGGTTNSIHKTGSATDITIKGMTPQQMAIAFDSFNGVGTYDTFVHIDSRALGQKGQKARWDFRTKK